MRTSTGILLLFLGLSMYIIAPVELLAVSGSSMEPTIPDGSLQVYIETTNVENGDIIVFESSERPGELIIHRIEETTTNGFITIGDNNNETDQLAGEDLVTSDRIQGVAPTIGETPIYIPHLGSIIEYSSQNLFESIVIFGLFIIIWHFSKSSIKEKHDLSILTNEDIVNPLFIIIFIVLTAAIVFGGPTVPVSIVHSESGVTGQPYVISLGEETVEQTIYINNPTNSGHSTAAVNKPIIDITRTQDELKITVLLEQQQRTGAETLYVNLYNHPPIVPQPVLQSLTNISPVISAFVSSSVSILPFYILYRVLGNPRQQIQKPRNKRLKRLYDKYID